LIGVRSNDDSCAIVLMMTCFPACTVGVLCRKWASADPTVEHKFWDTVSTTPGDAA
jgi:hypothetical protein